MNESLLLRCLTNGKLILMRGRSRYSSHGDASLSRITDMDQCFVHSLFRSKAKVCLLPFQALDYHLKEEEKNVFKIKFLAVNPTTFVCRHDPNVLEV